MKRILLYIPLCFYYIQPICTPDVPTKATLHSTMLLLYHSTRSGAERYISTLHSTMLLLYPRKMREWIDRVYLYIPLCFYYIYSHNRLCRLLSAFTFHYASTISRSQHMYLNTDITLHSTMLLLYPDSHALTPFFFDFTFHYASTISEVRYGTQSRKPPLHSTMLLLYHSLMIQSFLLLSLYIPLCFYYILVGGGGTGGGSYFTFHYASTISNLRDLFLFSLCHLYIPLCFYYIGIS